MSAFAPTVQSRRPGQFLARSDVCSHSRPDRGRFSPLGAGTLFMGTKHHQFLKTIETTSLASFSLGSDPKERAEIAHGGRRRGRGSVTPAAVAAAPP
jgi:hypothetical protein